jgi:hypothetical protein
MVVRLTDAHRSETGMALNPEGVTPVRHQSSRRRNFVQAVAVVGITATGMILSPMAGALADDGPASPASPIIRGADRGTAIAGASEVRSGTQVQDAHGNYVMIQGGDTSAGSPILVKDGNAGKLPTIGGEAGVICSASQNFHSAMIPCFG